MIKQANQSLNQLKIKEHEDKGCQQQLNRQEGKRQVH